MDFNYVTLNAVLSCLSYCTLLNAWRGDLNVAIIGKGQVGLALEQSLARVGHEVTFGVKSPASNAPNERTVSDAFRAANVTILAVPFTAIPDVIRSAGNLDGKIVIDATNPLGMDEAGLGLTMGFSKSGAEQIAALAPGALLCKTFNQTGCENLADAATYTHRPVMFVAGDDPNAKRIVVTLVSDIGFDPLDVGALRQARLLEPLAMLWIEVARKLGRGPNISFCLQQRGSAT
jgi:predicted dinucleotide-binding enzyme